MRDSNRKQPQPSNKSHQPKSAKTPSLQVNTRTKDDHSFPIVGMGASAGGLEAFEKFFNHMPADSGMAFVLVTHLDPGHSSMMTELVGRFTPMPVAEVTDDMPVEANRVYVIPPNRHLAIDHGILKLCAQSEHRGLRLPIDIFFRSLAADQGERAVAIILSGSGSDGTLGLQAIHAAGGLSLAQDPATAGYDGMPQSAINTGLVDLVLPPEQMPAQLLIYVKQFSSGKRSRTGLAGKADSRSLQKILFLLRQHTGHDFSLYKSSTILRRIERRMHLHDIRVHQVYMRYLEEHPEESQRLFKEFLILVTNFFRDTEAFSVIKDKCVPQLLDKRPEHQPLRVWVPGCGTGEEAYSLAMVLQESLDEHRRTDKINIFATDLDTEAIATARAGLYPHSIAMDVSPERLQRFFVEEESGYRIKNHLRESVVFAVHDLIKDPPFTRLDLLSCRNLLIYLEGELQHKLLPLFHYSLNPGGVLFLGPAETIGQFTDLFTVLDRKWKLYQRRDATAAKQQVNFAGITRIHQPFAPTPALALHKVSIAELAQKTLLDQLTPPSVLVNEKGDIIYLHGRTGAFLEPAPGTARMNILEMAREGCASELRAALHQAVTQKKDILRHHLKVKTNGGLADFHLKIKALSEPTGLEGMFLVAFEELTSPVRSKARRTSKSSQDAIALEQELKLVKEDLQATIEEFQAASEELKSANEELQSTNEELQSTNEEMETSKEEIQSINEELLTVNAELQAKVDQLVKTESDIQNLMNSTEIATIFLDLRLCLTRYTPAATRIFNLIPSDIGRPISHLAPNLEYQQLVADAQAVLDTLAPEKLEVSTPDRNWFQVRIIPYRTGENRIDGVVITCADITRAKQAEEKAQAAEKYAENIVATVREPLLVLSQDLSVISANHAFYALFQVSPEATVGRCIFDLGNRQWDIPELRKLLEEILPHKTTFEHYQVEHDFPDIGLRTFLLNARKIIQDDNGPSLILLAMEDVTRKGEAKDPQEIPEGIAPSPQGV
jgi:two-component system, chemotaxis family, CheB/CheR fusion protein